MSTSNLAEPSPLRPLVDGLLPPGSLFAPAPGGDLDRILDGIGDNWERARILLENLAHVRNPRRTTFLEDLEREYGISPNPSLTENTRRENLALAKSRSRRGALVARLQDSLDRAGFGLTGYGLRVTPNASPAADPLAIVENQYQLVAREFPSPAAAGNAAAYAAVRHGYYLVNGDQYQSQPTYPMAGQVCARAFDGSDTRSGLESAGHYEAYTLYANEYTTPAAEYWPYVVFFGGTVSRNADGSVAAIATVEIPFARRQELHKLILRYKPLGIWAAMCVQYT